MVGLVPFLDKSTLLLFMSAPTSSPYPSLRKLFDELIELDPVLRIERIASLALPEQVGIRLQAMVAFNDLMECDPESRETAMRGMDLPEKVYTRLCAMLVANSKVPALQSAVTHSWENCPDDDGLARALVGTSVGGFRLLALIGQGGSSAVFRAERQAGNSSQIVALKVLRIGLYSEDAQRRFRREQGILAQLSHPNIARLIEGGVSSAGIPYIAMELVEGLPITRAADKRCLSIELRLGWFFTLCRTIEAAHTMLIVHRDLKPSNLLVTDDGKLKVLDFGIAKLADREEMMTHTQSVALTPEYAAPEQLTSAPLTTAVDVYALGVLLSELLTGKRLKSGALASSSVDTRDNIDSPLPNGLPHRSLLARRLRGDLDAIIACALSEDPALRYQTASALADDIGRYLAGKPVRAHTPSRWYRTRKFIARHRVIVATTTIVMLTVLAALGIALWQFGIAREQAQSAREHAQRAESARNLLVSVFSAASAEVPPEKRPSVQDIVEQASSTLIAQNNVSDALRADLLLTLARVSDSVGSYDHALSLLDHMVLTGQSQDATLDTLSLDATVLRGSVLVHKSLFSEAAELLEPLSARLIARHDEIGVDGLLTLSIAMLHQGRVDESLALVHRTVLIAQAEAARMPDKTLFAMNTEASSLLDAMHFSEGFQAADAALAFWRQLGAPACLWIISLNENMAVAAEASGDIVRAETAYKESIAQGKRYFDKPSPALAWDMGIYGTFLIAQGRLDEAEPFARQGLEMRRTVFGESDPRTLYAIAGMGKLFLGQHDFRSAVDWNTQGVDICRTVKVQSNICARLLALRGRAYGLDGRFSEADRDLDDALAMQRSFSGDNTPDYAYILDNVLIVQVRRHDYKNAVATADRVLNIRNKVAGGMLQADLSTRFQRAQALFEIERNEEALTELVEIEPRYAHLVPKGDLRFDMLALKARALARAYRLQEASDAAESALAVKSNWNRPDSRIIEELKRLASADIARS